MLRIVDNLPEGEYPKLRAYNVDPSVTIHLTLHCTTMQLLPLFQPPAWTISDLTHYIRELLESDGTLQDLWVQGEVSNLSRPSSGHLYFTLKDSGAALRCVMWRNAVDRQAIIPRAGDAIEAHGNISVYEVSGQYQLYVDFIRPAGEGILYQEFLRLKARLEAEGLFDESRKRPIPPWPKLIGIVTSPTGAALRDMLNTLRRRYPLVKVILAPTPVQGEEAPAAIVAALNDLNEVIHPDVILLARGGGSIEDLWAFNAEQVARAIVASHAPVITGVGHETDFTIADFATDLRAPTPTAAAELATPDQSELSSQLIENKIRLSRVMLGILSKYQWELDTYQRQLNLFSPLGKVRSNRQRLDDLTRRAGFAMAHHLDILSARLAGIEQRLGSLNPRSILGRGYALVTKQDGRLVSRVVQVSTGESLSVRVSDGSFGVSVQSTGGKEG